MLGTGDSLFGPDAATTRGMIAAFLYRLEGEPAVKEETAFDDPITREQLVTILWRYAQTRLQLRGMGQLYLCCSQHGLMGIRLP